MKTQIQTKPKQLLLTPPPQKKTLKSSYNVAFEWRILQSPSNDLTDGVSDKRVWCLSEVSTKEDEGKREDGLPGLYYWQFITCNLTDTVNWFHRVPASFSPSRPFSSLLSPPLLYLLFCPALSRPLLSAGNHTQVLVLASHVLCRSATPSS